MSLYLDASPAYVLCEYRVRVGWVSTVDFELLELLSALCGTFVSLSTQEA